MKKLFVSLIFLIIFGGIAAGGYMFLKDMDPPTVVMEPDTGSVSPTQDITLHLEDLVSGVRSVSVTIRKGAQSVVIFEQVFPALPPKASVRFNLKKSGVHDGQIELEVRTTDGAMAGFGWGNTAVRAYSVNVDGTPPRITIVSPPGVSGRKGSAAAVSYTLSKKVSKTGVQVGDEFFPAYQQPDGEYFCLLASPIGMPPQQFVPEIVARDLAGNEARSRLLLPAQDRKYRNDTLKIDDAFLANTMPTFMELVPDAPNQLERYVRVNNEVRLANEAVLREIAKQTASVVLWRGTFMRLPGSTPKAAFGDYRTYKYGDQVIDYQTHMGQDLASVRHASIPAANSGTVVFTGDLGIFGKLVIIDHGLGLMSLYAHMSNIEVSVGMDVKRGDTLGATGTTGLAGGDHLHFGILVNGIQVQPLDWFDSNWIKNNITGRLIKK
jgi:murein DD-endopeptidase MepM/ murein hydrolase activator NlpD